jgi:hypothetical protein
MVHGLRDGTALSRRNPGSGRQHVHFLSAFAFE